MMSMLSMWALLAAAGLTAQGQALDEVDPHTEEVTSSVYADGLGGISTAHGTPGLLRSGDVIVSITLEPATGGIVCEQRSYAQKKTGTRRCGWFGLQSCAVISTRLQTCDVPLKDCDHFVWSDGQTKRTCASDAEGVVVGAPTRALPAVRDGLCSKPCDKGGGWKITGTTNGFGKPKAGILLGTVRYEVKRSD
jgi:hypothetical protein